MTDNLIRVEKVMEKTGLRKTTLYKLMRRGDFPSNIRLSSKTVAWIEAEVEQWMKERKAGKPVQQQKVGTDDGAK